MTHYDDLSACNYFGPLPAGPLLAVGWLEPENAYTKGDPGKEFYDLLKKLVETTWQPVYVMGGQSCGFCRYDEVYSYRNLFIPGNRVTYVAPEGILHYLAAHDYCPPSEFCEAVKNCPDMGSLAYFEALRSNGWSDEFARPEAREAAWREERRQSQIVISDGNALVARIEAIRGIDRRWPKSLQETQEHKVSDAVWHYEATDQGYHLDVKLADAGFRLIWNPQLRLWRKFRISEGNDGKSSSKSEEDVMNR